LLATGLFIGTTSADHFLVETRINPFEQKLKKFAFSAFLCLTLFSGTIAFADLSDTYRSIKNGQMAIPSWLREEIDHYQFVFIGGFGNELSRGYFSPTEKTFRELGATRVFRIFPSSLKAAQTNTHLILKQLEAIYSSGGGRPIIEIGHSKGGLESVALVLENPELSHYGIIKRVVPIQAPLVGCYLADLSGNFLHIDGSIARRISVLDGARSLRSCEIEETIQKKLNSLSPDDREAISNSLLYVTSRQEYQETARLWSVGTRVMNNINVKESDGLVATKQMWIPGFGRVLGELQADHTELLLSASGFNRLIGLTSSAKGKAEAFATSLAIEILQDIRASEAKGAPGRRIGAQNCRQVLTH
jgi:hypothetical protein